MSRSTAGTTSTLRVEEHTCRSWRCGERGRTESWIRKFLSSVQHPVEALGGFAQGGGSFQHYPPPDTAGVDPSNLLVLNLTVEIHSPVKQGLSKRCWPSDHPWGSASGLGNPSPSTHLCSGPRSMDRSLWRDRVHPELIGGSSLSPFKPVGHHPHKAIVTESWGL